MAVLVERLYPGGKLHRLAQVRAPIAGMTDGRRVDRPPGEVGDDPHLWRMILDPTRHLLEGVEDGLHQAGMERVRNGEALPLDAGSGQ